MSQENGPTRQAIAYHEAPELLSSTTSPEPIDSSDNEAEEARERRRIQPSVIAQSLERLKTASLEANATRDRLPQPLFWSLFSAEIDRIKKAKRTRQLVQDLLG